MNKIFEALLQHSQSRPNAIAFTDDQGSITYLNLIRRIYGLASRLTDAPSTIGIAISDNLNWVIADLAIALSGRCMVPLPLFFSPMQLTHIVQDSQIELILTTDKISENIKGLGLSILQVDKSKIDTPSAYFGGAERIIYTSGSTGTPKGVRLSDRQINHVVDALIDATKATDQDSHLSILPFSLLLEQICSIYVPIVVGGKCHIAGDATHNALQGDPVPLAKVAWQIKPTTTVLVPQILDMWQQFMTASNDRAPSSLRFVAVGGAAIAEHALILAEDVGIPVFQGYGLSECASVVCLNRVGENRRGTVGKPLKGVDLKIIDDEIIVESPTVMHGYKNQHIANDQWHTGDLGYKNDDGTVVIIGRKDNQITISNSRNISPETIEELIIAIPAIKAAALTTSRSNDLALVIIPKTFNLATLSALSQIELKDYFQAHLSKLPSYMHPNHVFLCPFEKAVSTGLLSPTGVVNREKCRIFVQTGTAYQPEEQLSI